MPNAKRKRNGSTRKRRATPAVKPKILANNVSPRPVVARTTRPAPKANHTMRVCSITDPFCPASRGAKWPDGTSGNTLTEQFRGNTLMSGGSNGTNAFVFTANAPFGWFGTTATTATTATLDLQYNTYKASSMLATYGQEYRIVSFGLIARCVASATTASGVATFGTTGTVAFGTVLSLGSELYDEVAMKAIAPGMEFSWISQPRGTGARSFVPISAATPATSTDWTTLVIELSGTPSNAVVLNIEWFMNVEFTLKLSSGLASIAKPNPPKIGMAETAVSKVHSSLGSFIEGGVKQVEQSVAKHASDALASLVGDPLDALAALFSAI